MSTTITTETMRAISPSAWGGAELLREVEVPRPVPGATEILVRVHAAGVNPSDFKQRVSGGLGLWGDPPILGYDVSGVVEEVGLGVTFHRPGDAVFGMPLFPRQAGAYAEFVVAPARQFAPKPETLSHVEAAALPLAALTAWQFFVDDAGLRPGQRVLIHAAGGGVGHLAVQVAKALGATVVGTASAGKHELLRSLGADELIDYRSTAFETATDPVDVVLDTIGGAYAARSLDVLQPGGILLCLASPFEPGEEVAAEAERRGIRVATPLVEPDRLALNEVRKLAEAGQLKPVIDATFSLAEARQAHERGETGRTTGKIVLQVV